MEQTDDREKEGVEGEMSAGRGDQVGAGGPREKCEFYP